MYQRRAYPLGHISGDAQALAMQRFEQMRSLARSQSSGIPLYFSGNWSFIGPQPIQAGLSNSYSGLIWTLAVDPRDSDTVYVGTGGGGVWKTTDSGTNWAPLTGNLPASGSQAIVFDPTNPDIVYDGTGNYFYGALGVLKSTDGGSIWTTLTGFGADSTYATGYADASIWSLAIRPFVLLMADLFWQELPMAPRMVKAYIVHLTVAQVGQRFFPAT
jgi:hypothetical protein